MGTKRSAGFTIIETTLFLAISGVLVVALLAGTGASLGAQRYRDAAETFKSLLQQQYSDLTSIKNSRDSSLSCGSNASPSTGGTAENRGQSDCVLIGKYVRIQDSDISLYTVLGYQIDEIIGLNDVNDLKQNYALNISKPTTQTSIMEWGTRIAWPVTQLAGGPSTLGATAPREFGMLVVRSPQSGQIYTFTSNDVPDESGVGNATFTALLVEGKHIPGQGEQLVCIDSKNFLGPTDRGVYIKSYASGSTAIEIVTNQYMATPTSGMGTAKC